MNLHFLPCYELFGVLVVVGLYGFRALAACVAPSSSNGFLNKVRAICVCWIREGRCISFKWKIDGIRLKISNCFDPNGCGKCLNGE